MGTIYHEGLILKTEKERVIKKGRDERKGHEEKEDGIIRDKLLD